jgi:isoquinoline 1-oxidoreductase beta subunit
MATGASRTTRGYYELLRLAGAQTRLVLINAAAENWNIPAAELSTEKGMVLHKASNRSIGYGEIAAFAQVPAQLPQVTPAMLRKPADFKLIGKNVPRIDLAEKTRGAAKYGIDTRIDGMLYGAVLRAPVQKDKPVNIDDSAAKAVKGYVKTVPLPYGVGILAENTWAARQAKQALKVSWEGAAPARNYSSDVVGRDYLAVATDLDLSKAGVEVEKHGNATQYIKGAARVLKADFISEHAAHMCLEPMNATAKFTGDKLEIWSPTQSPSIATFACAGVLKMPPAMKSASKIFLIFVLKMRSS